MSEPIRAVGTTDIAAPPDVVWRMISDVTRMGEWSPECERCEWADSATAPAVGARFVGHNRHGERTWSTTSEVVEAVPGRCFAFAVRGADNPSSRWRYDLEALPSGETRLTESMEGYRTGFVAKTLRRLGTGVTDRAEHNRQGIAATLARIKTAAEAAV